MKNKKLKELLEREPWVYEFLAEEYKEKKELAIAAVNAGEVFEFLPEELKEDKDVLMAAIEYGDAVFDEMDEKMFRDMDIARTMVRVFPDDYERLPEDMQRDCQVALECVKVRGEVYEFFCRELKEDEEIMEEAIRHGLDLGEIAGPDWCTERLGGSEKLLQREELVRIAVEHHDGNQMRYASEELWENQELVEFALAKGFCQLKYLPEHLRTDKELIKRIVGNIPAENYGDYIFQLHFIGEELRKDTEFLLELIAEKEEVFQFILRCKKDEILTRYFPFEADVPFCKKAYQVNPKTLKYMNKQMKQAVKV